MRQLWALFWLSTPELNAVCANRFTCRARMVSCTTGGWLFPAMPRQKRPTHRIGDIAPPSSVTLVLCHIEEAWHTDGMTCVDMQIRHAGKAERNLHAVPCLNRWAQRWTVYTVWVCGKANLCILLASETVMCQQIKHCRVSRVTIICLAQQLQALTIALQHRAGHQLCETRTVPGNQLHQHALVPDSKECWIGQQVQHPLT